MTALAYDYFESPIGPLLLAGDRSSLHYLSFPRGSRAFEPRRGWEKSRDPFAGVRSQLEAYFAGDLVDFDLPLTMHGSAFQKSVWSLLATIPYGKTTSYGALARQLGDLGLSRAVGAANGANPLPIVIPCHRVIGADGSLTGFGGGLDTKRFLLTLEGSIGSVAPSQLSLL